MAESFNIQYILNRNIDRKKWDSCMDNASNSLIYGYSAFLDNMAKTWDGLVLGDYDAVMPLPLRKKMGISYIFQPFLTPILGVFGNNINQELVTRFLEAIPDRVKLWDISLNHFNPVSPQFQQQYYRNNFILDLSKNSYEQFRERYSDNVIRNINKAIKLGCHCKKNIPVADIIEICAKQWPSFTKVVAGAFDNIPNLHAAFEASLAYGVYSREGKLLTACLFLSHGNRAYYWLVGNDPDSKDTGASHFLIDQFIRDHAGKNLVLDFEGSDVKGIAEFYERFGAISEPYTTLYRNRLPFPLSLMKKTPTHYQELAQKGVPG